MFINMGKGVLILIFMGWSVAVFAQDGKSSCRSIGSYFQKNVCSGIENNKAFHIKNLMEQKSGGSNLEAVLDWTKANYDCFSCKAEPGFKGGSLLRKVAFENALTVAFFFVFDARVGMNLIEEDGKTLADWLRDDTEATFDAAMDAVSDIDRSYLIKQIRINQKFFNLFRNNGAKFRAELIE
ncbi:hypothetical protein ACFLR1_00825 [Bacteroidota bacterium]